VNGAVDVADSENALAIGAVLGRLNGIADAFGIAKGNALGIGAGFVLVATLVLKKLSGCLLSIACKSCFIISANGDLTGSLNGSGFALATFGAGCSCGIALRSICAGLKFI